MSEGLIYQTIPKLLAEVGVIGKDQKNKQQGFMYRGVDDVYNTIHPLLAKHKIFCTSEILDQKREERTARTGGNLIYSCLTMKYTFWAADGSSVCTQVVGEGMDSGDKASNKAMSIAYKYALFQMLCIPTEAVDPDADVHNVEPKNGKSLVDDATLQSARQSIDEKETRQEIQDFMKLAKEAVGTNLNDATYQEIRKYAMARYKTLPEPVGVK